MPLFFASNAIYPIEIMPDWLKWIAHVNPLTYEVDGLRVSMLAGAASGFGFGVDFAVLGSRPRSTGGHGRPGQGACRPVRSVL